MPRMKKLHAADDVQAAAMGHNVASEETKRGHIEYVAKKMIEIQRIKGDLADRKRKAKDDGMLKTSLTDSVKLLLRSEEKLQAFKEIQHETQLLYDLGAPMPLFSAYRREQATDAEAQ